MTGSLFKLNEFASPSENDPAVDEVQSEKVTFLIYLGQNRTDKVRLTV